MFKIFFNIFAFALLFLSLSTSTFAAKEATNMVTNTSKANKLNEMNNFNTTKKLNTLTKLQPWIESADITSILSHVDANTLVVFDIDYTLFRAGHSLGTPEWIMHLIDNEVKQGKSREEGFKKYYPLWMKAQQFNNIVLMDKKIPLLLQKITEQGGTIIALTSRQSSCKEMTDQQLQSLGLNLNKYPMASIQFNSTFKYPAVFYRGVLFSHDFNEKGAVFVEWMKQIAVQLKSSHVKPKQITKVVFVDDLAKNVVSMQQAVQSLGLEFQGLRYSAGDQYKAKFNPEIAEREAALLMESLNKLDAIDKNLKAQLEH